MTTEEKMIYKLRSLYENSGYRRYKMSKFEEYDLYARNKDLLASDGIITFTDTNGKLMALKPDVTFSIIRNTRAREGEVSRVYYNENVYRVSQSSKAYREIMQTGLECIGAVDDSCVLEVAALAAKSLKEISCDAVLVLSLPSLLSDAASDCGLVDQDLETALRLIADKNIHELRALLKDNCEDYAAAEKLVLLAGVFGEPDEAIPQLAKLCGSAECISQLDMVVKGLSSMGLSDMLRIDMSAECGTRYYSGLIFKGYVSGIPSAVLSGGRYDALTRRMGKKYGAIGFAVYMDLLERYRGVESAQSGSDHAENDKRSTDRSSKTLNIALPKGRLGEKVYRMFAAAGFECPEVLEESRKLIFTNEEKGVSYFWVKPSDVSVYVERGAADIGVCGKDILLEYEPDVYELLDLKTGKCRMAVATKSDFADDPSSTLTVATKFGNIASKYYASLGRDIDIVHLNGSIELAPILGISDVIVDIVETGTTLRENDLHETELIAPISARLIANKANYEFCKDAILSVMEGLERQVAEK